MVSFFGRATTVAEFDEDDGSGGSFSTGSKKGRPSSLRTYF